MQSDISIVDYGSGNLLSVRRAFEQIGCRVNEVQSEGELLNAKKIVLPGVGSFPNGMNKLKEKKLDQSLKNAVGEGIPILGICLGMQLLFEHSTEFEKMAGLGVLPGKVTSIKKLLPDAHQRIPRIGWFNILPTQSGCENPILKSIHENTSFYFAHSFAAFGVDSLNLVASSEISNDIGAAAIVSKDSTVGVQFHPEKSGKAGLKLLENFIENF